jgi:hypothetical protein
MSGTVDLTTCVDEEAGYHDMHMQGVQQLQGMHSLYGGLFDDTNPEYLGYLSSHRTHLSDFDHAALPSPSLSYQRARMGGEAAQEQQHGFDMIAADGGMLHMPHLMLQQHHNHPHSQAPCPLLYPKPLIGGGDGQYSGEGGGGSLVEHGGSVGGSVKRGCGSTSSGAATPVRAEADKKRLKREGSHTPVHQLQKAAATTPAAADKKGLRSFSGQVRDVL